MKNKTFCIGDIHGNYKGLLQVLKKSNFNYDNDTLITLGDIADGWSEVPQCVDELLNIKNRIDIGGNHDLWLYEWLKFGMMPNVWVNQGGRATINAYLIDGKMADPKHLDFFAKQANYYIDDKNRAFVHGGYTSHKGAGHELSNSQYYWDRTLWDIALASKKNWDKGQPIEYLANRLTKHSEIFLGHTSTMSWKTDQPIKACNVWNLDTGSGWAGRLTIMDIDTKEYWQSDLTKKLYPEEKGR